MYINPFIAGIMATIACEVCCAIVYAIMHRHDDYEAQEIPIELNEANKEDIKELIKVLDRMSGKHEQDNNDKGE